MSTLPNLFGALAGGDGVVVRDRVAAGGLDLGDDLVRHLAAAALARAVAAEVVDDDLGALFREQQRVGAADAAARSSDDRYLPVEESHGRERSSDRAVSSSAPDGHGFHIDAARSWH